MKGNRIIVGALVAVIATVAGCTLTIDFDPRGVDVSLEGYWTINGNTPDPALCGAAGIDTVQLVFYDGGAAYEFLEFRFDCAQGGFDTGSRGVLDHGRYQTQWLAYDAAGVRVGEGPMISLDVSNFSVDHAVLLPVDFVTVGFNPIGNVGSLEASWTINGNPADASLCALGDLQTMQFVLYAATDTGRTDGVPVAMAPCADGIFDSGVAILAAGDYITSVLALDSTGAAVATYDSPFPFVVTTPGRYELMAAPFEITAPLNEMTINLSWGPTGGDCVTAGADSIFWELNDSAGNPILAADPIGTCAGIADVLIFSDLTPGTYELFVDAESADRLTKWQGTCEMLVHDGGTTMYPCRYELMP